MLEWMVSSSVLILIVIIIRYALKGKIKLWLQYALWGLVLIRLLIPFSIGSSELSVSNFLPEQLQQENEVELQEIESFRDDKIQGAVPGHTEGEKSKPQELSFPLYTEKEYIEENVGESVADITSTEPEKTHKIHSFLKTEAVWNVIWGIGFIFVGSVLLVANITFASRLKKSRKRVEVSAERLRVYRTEAVETPCLFGIVSPAIYLTPAAMENDMVLWHVLEHENTHHRHKDHIWSMLRGVCLAVHWYNPLVWWAASLSRVDAELACDEATIHRIGEKEREEYGRTLLGMTCRKRTALFITATTMTGSKRGIKERVILLVKKPKMAIYTLVGVIALALFAVGCTFTGKKEAADDTKQPLTTPTVTVTAVPTQALTATPETTATVSPTKTPEATATVTMTPTMMPVITVTITPTATPVTAPEFTPTPTPVAVLKDQMLMSKSALYFATHFIWESTAGGDYRYVYYSNQEAVIAALEKAKAHVQENKGIQEDDIDSGIYVVYEDEWWLLTEEGALVGIGLGRIEAEYTKELVSICEEAMSVMERWGPVRPEELVGITEATLRYNNKWSTITDRVKLVKLEQWLSQSEPLFGGSSCPFTALLILERENGKQVTISLATDSCGVWMSEGAFYQYAGGNEELFELFVNQELLKALEEMDGDMDKILAWLPYADWEEYAGYDDKTTVISLFGKILRWVQKETELTAEQVCLLMSGAKGLDGPRTTFWRLKYEDILEEAYQKNEQLFASCWISKLGASEKETVLQLMAGVWNLSVEDAEKLLEEKSNEPETRRKDFLYFENDDGTLTIIKYTGTGRNVAIPERIGERKVTILGVDGMDGVFENCQSIHKVTIPEGITLIGDNSFSGCESLKTVVFAKTVEGFGDNVFLNCTKLEKLYFEGDMPKAGETMFDIDSDVFVYYPKGNTSWEDSWCGQNTRMY